MVPNSTRASSFILGAYLQLGSVRFVCFAATALLYVLIVAANSSLVALLCGDRRLRQPMFVLLCSLLVNELYGSSAVFPFLLLQLLSDVHAVSASCCFLQIFCVYTYGSVEFLNLAAMAYDRYLAVCRPLHYSRCMTPARAALLVVLLWCYSFVKFAVTLSLNLRLPLCGNVLNSLYCQNYLVVKLACSADTELNNIYGLFGIVLTVAVPLVPIFFSYVKILRICYGGCGPARQKALSTCSPQLVSLVNFSFGCCFEIVQSRFNMDTVPSAVRLPLSLYFLILQPLLNPLVYGLQMSQIRRAYRRVFCT